MRRVIVPLLFVVLVSLAAVLPPVYGSTGGGDKTAVNA